MSSMALQHKYVGSLFSGCYLGRQIYSPQREMIVWANNNTRHILYIVMVPPDTVHPVLRHRTYCLHVVGLAEKSVVTH